MHDPKDYMIGDTRIISNPRGYIQAGEGKNFKKSCIPLWVPPYPSKGGTGNVGGAITITFIFSPIFFYYISFLYYSIKQLFFFNREF